MKHENSEVIEMILNSINDHFTIYNSLKKNIFLFGSYLDNMISNNELFVDVDIAVIFKIIPQAIMPYLIEKTQSIRADMLQNHHIVLDLYIGEAKLVYGSIHDPFYNNIRQGLCIYREYEYRETNIDTTTFLFSKATRALLLSKKLIKAKEYKQAVVAMYFTYYYCMSYLLIQDGSSWESEVDLLCQFQKYIEKEDASKFHLPSFFTVEYLKNNVLYNYYFDATYLSGILRKEINFLLTFYMYVSNSNQQNHLQDQHATLHALMI